MNRCLIIPFMFIQCLLFAQAPMNLTQDPTKQLVIENPSKIVLPPDYDASKKYPMVIFLPATGGTATTVFSGYAYQTEEVNNSLTSGEGFEIDFSPLIDSLNRMPTDDEANAYMDKIMNSRIYNSNNSTCDNSTKQEEAYLAALLKSYFGDQMQKKSFILMLPDGAGSTVDHDWKGFSACIFRYENRILEDIETYSKKYSIDQDKIILVGFSLGGDLSWAITNRYPEKFKGAIISGSRCSYSEKGSIPRLAKKNARYYIAMGDNESADRMKGAKYAVDILTKATIKNMFKTIPDSEHSPASFEQLKEALNFVLFD